MYLCVTKMLVRHARVLEEMPNPTHTNKLGRERIQGTVRPKWTCWDLNPGPSACEADVIPLHHKPVALCSQSRVLMHMDSTIF